MKCRMFVTTIALLLVASIAAVAAPDKGKGKGGGGLLPAPIVEKLTPEQKAKYDAILKDAKAAHGDQEKMKEFRKKAIDLLTDEQKAELKNLSAKGKGKK